MASADETPHFDSDRQTGGEHKSPPKSRFRFKSKKRRDRTDNGDCESRGGTGEAEESRRSSRREGRHHHRSKRSRTSAEKLDDPSLYDDTYLPNTSSSQYLDPDTAFRESLFDAMADEESADYWQGVYGQPIHTYPNVKEGPRGELEKMTDEEYTAYVRGKMYEKTHQHLVEEKARRDAARKERERLTKEGEKEAREAARFRRKVEESLKRGEERKNKKTWEERWLQYTTKWETIAKAPPGETAIASIPWPVESGRRKDVSLEAIRRFLLYAPSAGQPTESQLGRTLKLERVRWHPDKIQQKLGGQAVGEDVMQAVTEVFQVIDRLWSEVRDGNR